MVENDEDLLKRFFDEHTFQVEDDGFSRQVMRHINRRSVILNRLWTTICALAGVAILLFSDAMKQLRQTLYNLMGDLIGAVSAIDFSLVSPLAIYLSVLTLCVVMMVNVVSPRS